jgi:hypothetical protein
MLREKETILRHNFAIWVMGKRPGFFKPQRYIYRCLRCKWAFMVNDEHRGALRVARDDGVELSDEEAQRRLATFELGPCPGYQSNADRRAVHAPAARVIPMRKQMSAASAR